MTGIGRSKRRIVDRFDGGIILLPKMLPKILFSDDHKISPVFFVFLLLAISFAAYYLDIVTRNMIAFDAFYFPSIMLATWYLGSRAGFLMVFLITLLWSSAQGFEGYAIDRRTFFLDGAVHFVIFSLIFGLTGLVRRSAVLLEAKSKELVRSNGELEQFAYRAAHDLKAPLTNIFSYTEFLVEKNQKPGDSEAQECAEGILRSVRRMDAMIKALLEYATVMKKEKETASSDLGKVVAETQENLQGVIAEKKAKITYDPLPALRINPGLAGLLFQNLIGNAMKYCEREPRIHVSAIRRGKDWVFSVQDNGIGIPEESRERIFIMFEKLPTKHQYPGSGIGLATCQKIVERCGGRIWVESPSKDESVQTGTEGKTGEGSTFFFTLPAS